MKIEIVTTLLLSSGIAFANGNTAVPDFHPPPLAFCGALDFEKSVYQMTCTAEGAVDDITFTAVPLTRQAWLLSLNSPQRTLNLDGVDAKFSYERESGIVMYETTGAEDVRVRADINLCVGDSDYFAAIIVAGEPIPATCHLEKVFTKVEETGVNAVLAAAMTKTKRACAIKEIKEIPQQIIGPILPVPGEGILVGQFDMIVDCHKKISTWFVRVHQDVVNGHKILRASRPVKK